MEGWLLPVETYQGAQVRKLYPRVVVFTARTPSGLAHDFWFVVRKMAGSVITRLELFDRLSGTKRCLSSPYRHHLRPFPREAIVP